MPNTPKQDIWILIPAYNEQERLGSVIDGLLKEDYSNIIVVDDCSTDATLQTAQKRPIVALSHAINRGQGAALRTGTAYFLRHTSGKYLIHFDADGQHRVEDIPAMVAPLVSGKCDITTGSRFLTKAGIAKIPKSKRLTLKIGVLFNYIVYGIKATDAHNGFRALTRKAAELIDFNEDRMEHATEIAELIQKKKLRHKEIPVVIEYHEYGQTFMHGVKMARRLLIRKLMQ